MKDSKKKHALPGFRSSDFEVSGKSSLSKFPTKVKKLYKSDEEADRLFKHLQKRLSQLQENLYAEGRQSLLIILQGMDTAGKDSLTKHVMSGVNPQGVVVTSFKQPTADDVSHDFLWRSHSAMPRRGEIGIFNRSYYEEVLITRVHEKLIDDEHLPSGTKIDGKFWKARLKDIASFEKYLDRQGYTIVKFFLHLSKKEQKSRLQARIKNPDKHWKFDPNDVLERQSWDKYQKAYAEALTRTSTKHAPWYALPADDKTNTRLMALKIVNDILEQMHPDIPATSPLKKREIKKAAKKLRKN